MYYISMRRDEKIFVCFFAIILTVIGIVYLLGSLFGTPVSQPASPVSPLAVAIFIGLMGLAGLIFGVVLFFTGFRTMKKKKLMESLPTSKIRSLAIGIAEIYGKVVPDKGIMKSPFSNRDCVGVKIIIEEERRGGGGGRGWAAVKKLVRGIDFFLQDDTGKVLVDLRGAELDIPVSYEYESGSRAGPPPIYGTLSEDDINKLEDDINKLGGFLRRNKTLRYSESIIVPGDELYILGRADDNPNFREGDAEHGVQDLMMQQSHNPNIYFISTRSEKQILEKMKYKVIAAMFAGPLFIGGSLLIIALNFEMIL